MTVAAASTGTTTRTAATDHGRRRAGCSQRAGAGVTVDEAGVARASVAGAGAGVLAAPVRRKTGMTTAR
jgi:hypothetical protein